MKPLRSASNYCQILFTSAFLIALTNQMVAATAAIPDSPQTLTSEQDNFRIIFPGKPSLKVTPDRNDRGQDTTQRQWTLVTDDSMGFSVTVSPVDLEGEQINRFLTLLKINQIAENGVSADLRSDKQLTLKGGVKAFEIEMPLKGEFSEVASNRQRFFVAEGRMYILTVSGLIEDVRSRKADDFLNSFELIRSRTTTVTKRSTGTTKVQTQTPRKTYGY
ncbi:MAG: hypothetical protein R3C20_12335 [Planctomycetaceae bacterium]